VLGTVHDGTASLTRLPDGLRLSAFSWDDVWAACPELGVTWRSVTFESDAVRQAIVTAWGTDPNAPT
jgi:hypothetical protein